MRAHIPQVLILAEESFKVKLGDVWFYHSKVEKSFYLPLRKVELTGSDYVLIRLSKNNSVCLLHSEIKEIQFV